MSRVKTRHIYDDALEYEKLYSAWNTVLRTCKNKQGLFEFAMFGHARVARLLDELKERNYYPNKYRCFMIFEPKPRLVMSQSIRDKVVNHFVAREYLIPLLEHSLVDANVATRKGLGAAQARKYLKKYFSQLWSEKPGAKIYALKVDVAKYFYSIDHEILFKKLEKRIKDKDVIGILRRITNETNRPYINNVIDMFNRRYNVKIPHYEYGKGLSIGAMTSQFLAIFYLNDLDHYLKEKVGCKYFIRYMDDFLILGHSKRELTRIRLLIEEELRLLKLQVNPKTAIYDCTNESGISFLGYRYYVTRNGRMRAECLAKTVKRVRKRLQMLETCDHDKYEKSYAAYKGYFMYSEPLTKMAMVVGKIATKTRDANSASDVN